MNKIKYGIFLGIILLIYIKIPTHAQDESLQLYAQSAVLMDGESGRILYSKSGDEGKANASTTKILTCIVALEHGEILEEAKVSRLASAQPKVHLGAKEGEIYLLEDMLYALMLESYNDCAVVIAEHIAGSVDEYMELVNDKASEIGCVDTFFITPNGLDAEEGYEYHHSTAQDLALILRYCIMESPMKDKFLEITQKSQHTFGDVNGQRSFTCVNRNTLLTMMSGAISGKTGFTTKAGYCYVGAIESEGRTYIVALLACGWPGNKTYKWSDCEKLFTYGKENFEFVTLKHSSSLLDDYAIMVENSSNVEGLESIDVKVVESENVKVLMKDQEEAKIEVEINTLLRAPVSDGTIIGTIRYKVEETTYKVDSIVTNSSVDKYNIFREIKYRFMKVFS